MPRPPARADAATAPLPDLAVLVVASPGEAEEIARGLRTARRAVHMQQVGDPRALEAALADPHWDLVIADTRQAEVGVVTLVAAVRRCAPDVPLVVIGDEAAVEIVRAGAAAYVPRNRRARMGAVVEAVLRDAQERRARERLELDLRRGEERFRVAVTALPLSVFQQDTELRYTWITQPLVPLEVEQILGHTDEELIGAALAAPFTAVKRRVLERGSGERADIRLVHDGPRWIDLTVEPMRDEAGRIVGITGAAIDVTTRRTIEDALRESEHRVRLALEHAPIVLFAQDRELRYLWVQNPAGGLREQDVVGRTDHDLLPPEQAAILERVKRAVLESGLGRNEEVELTPGAGHHWYDLTVEPVFGADGRIDGVTGVAVDISRRKRMEDELRHLADRDALTGLFNRRRLWREIERQIAHIARYRGAGTLLVADLDHFKYVNDSLGHKAGDELIQLMASLLRERLRATDVLARLGGDEFAVVLPQTDLDHAEQVADQLLRAVSEHEAVIGGRRIRVTASIGLADLGTPGATPGDLLAAADLAMYAAKNNGRDQVARAGAGTAEADRILGWSERVRTALRDDRFELYGQPIFDARTGSLVRRELLLRMHTDRDLVLPGAFMHTAERYGLVKEIDRWVVGRAMDLVAAAPEDGTTLAVNLSGPSVGDPEVADLIERDLAERGLDPGRLSFEITETTAIVDMEAARRFAQRLRALGCLIALDDFGSGFGSFTYLKHLPVDDLKIDGDFVRQLPGNAADGVLVKAIVDVARGLGMRTVAEHVGSEPALDLLRELGVDLVQGFYLARPEPLVTAG